MLRSWILVLGLVLLAAAADSDRYIVELTGDSVAAHLAKEKKRGMDSEAARTRRVQILEEQRQAAAALKALGAEVLDATQELSNTLIVRMPAELVPKVEALPIVKRVRRPRTFRPAGTRAGA